MQNISSDMRKARSEITKNGGHEATSDTYPEIDDIRRDWSALTRDVAKLSRHAGTDSRKTVSDFSRQTFEKLERQVTQKPAQTLAVAFFAGAIASLFLGRR